MGAHDICCGFINLINSDNVGNPCCFNTSECFKRLRLYAVFSRDNENRNISDVCSAVAHFLKGFVAWCIEKSDLFCRTFLRRMFNYICREMLGDSAGFTLYYIRFADIVKNRRFAMVNMTHNNNDRRSNDNIRL